MLFLHAALKSYAWKLKLLVFGLPFTVFAVLCMHDSCVLATEEPVCANSM